MLDSLLYKSACDLERVMLVLWEITGAEFIRRAGERLFYFGIRILLSEV